MIDGPYNARELDIIEDFTRRLVHTSDRWVDGDSEKTHVLTDSGGMGDDAHNLRLLAEYGRFRIVRQFGRMVVGYWPENDPERKTT